MTWDSKYFTENEMRCQCGCGRVGMEKAFMEKLNYLRTIYDKPMVVSSGYRCPDHPIEARKPSPGAHATGKAADIAVDKADALRLVYLAIEFGFTGIGVQQKGNGRFIHLDTCTEKDGFPRPTIWSY
jgi:uncharacterized protein YcbK (DUF882 family)